MNKQTITLINDYCDAILPGFSEENWIMATRILRDLSPLIDLEAYSALGDLMGEMYASPNTDTVVETRKMVINHLHEQG